MKNLINFFFSFDKLMKEKLIVPFFWLSIIVVGTYFSTVFLDTILLEKLSTVLNFLSFPVLVLFALVSIRLLCELIVAVFRINDNLSPDGGKSELANINPMEEARKAAEAAAAKARELSKTAGEKASAATKTAVEKTKHAADSVKDSAGDLADSATAKAKSATSSTKASVKAATKPATKTTAALKKRGRPAGTKNATTANKTTAKAATKPATKSTSAPKKRGRPAGAKNKTAPKKKSAPSMETTKTLKKRGPKPGSKAPRDAQGRLLKKDGTLRGKPGPKK